MTLKLDETWGVTETEQGYHFYPHKTKGEGFYLAILRKTTDVEHPLKLKPKQSIKDKKLNLVR